MNTRYEQDVVKKTQAAKPAAKPAARPAPRPVARPDAKTARKPHAEPKVKAAAKAKAPAERRSSPRYPLGLPVHVHLAGHAEAMTVELMDLSAGGGRFRSAVGTVRLNQTASLAFVVPGPKRCLAKGRVVRTDGAGEFAVSLNEANKAFLGFVEQLAS